MIFYRICPEKNEKKLNFELIFPEQNDLELIFSGEKEILFYFFRKKSILMVCDED
jgi:hypothetical protein